MKWARIQDNRVIEVVTEDPKGRYHPSIEWWEITDDIQENYILFNGVFLPDTHYSIQRTYYYPSVLEYIDGLVKTKSTDPEVAAAGQAQIDKYINDCLKVKLRFPKEQE